MDSFIVLNWNNDNCEWLSDILYTCIHIYRVEYICIEIERGFHSNSHQHLAKDGFGLNVKDKPLGKILSK